VKEVFSNTYLGDEHAIRHFVNSFTMLGRDFDKRNRNSLKLFQLGDKTINIKSFKKPNLQPIAYFEERTAFRFKRSYYVSEHLEYDLTYRELVKESEYTGDESILTAFGKFTYELHKKGIEFLDHSLGNTLITIKNENYHFYLVDLNRMKFGMMDFETRMKNFERLSKDKEHVRHMARGYAQESGENEETIYQTMHKYILAFQDKFYRKKRWKKRLKISR